MKPIKILLLALFIWGGVTANAQVNDKEALAALIASKEFVFNATTALPMNTNDISRIMSRMQGPNTGGTIQLNGMQYDLELKGDTLESFLPYYGRAFNAPYNPSEGGIKFTSKDFTYKESRKRRGGWVISMATKDVRENQRFTLEITETGYATLVAVSNNRQPISFYGTIDKPQAKK